MTPALRRAPTIPDDGEHVQSPPIVYAVMAKDLELVKHRISLGLDVNFIDPDKGSALMQAVHRDLHDIARLLLRHGASPADIGPHDKCAMQFVRSGEMAKMLNDHCIERGIPGSKYPTEIDFIPPVFTSSQANDTTREKKRYKKDHIHIGNDDYINLQNELLDHDSAESIDQYLIAIDPLLTDLEIQCAAGCCGIYAFDFTREVLGKLKDKHAENRQAISNCIEAIRKTEAKTIVSDRMNAYMNTSSLIQLLEYIHEELGM